VEPSPPSVARSGSGALSFIETTAYADLLWSPSNSRRPGLEHLKVFSSPARSFHIRVPRSEGAPTSSHLTVPCATAADYCFAAGRQMARRLRPTRHGPCRPYHIRLSEMDGWVQRRPPNGGGRSRDPPRSAPTLPPNSSGRNHSLTNARTLLQNLGSSTGKSKSAFCGRPPRLRPQAPSRTSPSRLVSTRRT